MKKFKKTDFIAIIVLLTVTFAVICLKLLTGNSDTGVNGSLQKAVSPEDFNTDGKVLGIRTGSAFEIPTKTNFHKSQYLYFDTDSDLITALYTGKIDGYLNDEPVAKMQSINNPDIDYFIKPVVEDEYCFAFPKDTPKSNKIRGQFNEFLKKLSEKDEINRLIHKWMEGPVEERVYDDSPLSGENGILSIAVPSDFPPFSYYHNNKLTGFVQELCTSFAREYGYGLKFEEVKVTSMLAGIATGKYDIAASAISITEERQKVMDFSDVYYHGGMVLMVRSSEVSEGTYHTTKSSDTDSDSGNDSFFDKIADSFERNFIKEERYMLVLKGIGITLLITVLSVIFGSILAFLVCLMRRLDSIVINFLLNLYIKIFQGTPILVVLMILYYVVFAKSDIEALWVAVMAFTLNFGAYGSEIMMSGINSIDKGQTEASLALGFTRNQAFFKFIYPQAAVRFIPVYKQEIISLLKNTSVVGYIAINDLTKVTDIIRGQTFEALFPLVVTAVIYFIIACLISLILKKVLKVIDPVQRKKNAKRKWIQYE